MNENIKDINDIKEESINAERENINKWRNFIYINIISALILSLFLILGIILIIIGYSIGNINYDIKTNCTVIYPLMNRYSKYYSVVSYTNIQSNKTNIAESISFSLEEYYTKYNYKINDTVTCFSSTGNINSISFYQQSIYSSDKETLIIVGYVCIACCPVTFCVMFLLSLLASCQKENTNQQNNHSV